MMQRVKWFEVIQIAVIGLFILFLLWGIIAYSNFHVVSEAWDKLDEAGKSGISQTIVEAKVSVDLAWDTFTSKALAALVWLLMGVPVILIFCICKIIDDIKS